ncbi:barwin-like endoglucanase, partial [Tanacetum coccineum]
MGVNHPNLFLIVICACLVTFAIANPEFYADGYGYEDEHANVHAWYHGHGNHGYGRPYSPALGTWYGDPNGAGSGGACGLANDVQNAPYHAMIAAGNSRIFKQGKGCGECYQ